MQVQVRTINVICAVLLVLAGFLIDNKVDARAIKKRSSDVSAEEYKRALVDALAHALVKSHERKRGNSGAFDSLKANRRDDQEVWTEHYAGESGESSPSGAASGSSGDSSATDAGFDSWLASFLSGNADPDVWTESGTWGDSSASGAGSGSSNNGDQDVWSEVASRAAKQTAGKGKTVTKTKTETGNGKNTKQTSVKTKQTGKKQH
ncbi:unnamed protein product [Adineta steineri]|uniref:Uncharacterized protein n=1 Tax=Adineta steineri TaxID=433720 RepID=A0A815SHN4_9BILA|nr:unnamed protein product [Adineta steineri]CAF1446668.1 unnamed protein product [Adineta steineri]CAF1492539.1 unnamed protein product [Adineta steineri]